MFQTESLLGAGHQQPDDPRFSVSSGSGSVPSSQTHIDVTKARRAFLFVPPFLLPPHLFCYF